ncbi:MAG: AlpA family phage regulatory protein [Hyphomicrobiales bacterium]
MEENSTQQIETVRQSATAIGVSYSTIRRMIAAGDFPKPIQLSPRRQGILIAQRKAWIAARAGEAA